MQASSNGEDLFWELLTKLVEVIGVFDLQTHCISHYLEELLV
jgi:hypothetical protein